jgi:predicted DNA-binding transcriptional regulator AlpA
MVCNYPPIVMSRPRRPSSTLPPAPDPNAPGDRFLDFHEVRRRVGGLTKTTILKYRREGLFPEPVHFGPRVFWSERELDHWIAARKAARDRVAS